MPGDPSLFLSPLRESQDPAEAPEPERGDVAGAPPPVIARRARPRRPARAAAVAAVVGLLLAGGATNRLRSQEGSADGSPSSAPPRAGPSATPPPPLPATPGTPPSVRTVARLETVARLGPRLPRPTGTTLALVGDDRLVVADLDAGVVRTAALPPGAGRGLSSQVLVPTGDVLLVGGPTATQVVPRASGAPAAALPQPPAFGILPSSRPGAFWTITASPGAELVERTLDGEEARRLALREDPGPMLPAGDGFIVSPGGQVTAVDAGTGLEKPLLDGVALAYDGRTLVRSTCAAALDCGLVLSDLDGGGERAVGPPTPRSQYATFGGASFSPDGRWLVMPFAGEDQPGGLVLIDVERGERRPVAGLTTASGGGFLATAAFTADSSWLLFTDRTEQTGGLKAVDLSDGSVLPVALDPPGGVDGRRGALVLAAFPSIPADADLGG